MDNCFIEEAEWAPAKGTRWGGCRRDPGVCLAQDSWVVAFSPVELSVLSPGRIVKKDNWYLKIHRKCSYHNVIIVMTQKSRIAHSSVPVCPHFCCLPSPQQQLQNHKERGERERERKRERNPGQCFIYVNGYIWLENSVPRALRSAHYRVIDGCQGQAGWQIAEGKWTDDVVAFEGLAEPRPWKELGGKQSRWRTAVAPACLLILSFLLLPLFCWT